MSVFIRKLYKNRSTFKQCLDFIENTSLKKFIDHDLEKEFPLPFIFDFIQFHSGEIAQNIIEIISEMFILKTDRIDESTYFFLRPISTIGISFAFRRETFPNTASSTTDEFKKISIDDAEYWSTGSRGYREALRMAKNRNQSGIGVKTHMSHLSAQMKESELKKEITYMAKSFHPSHVVIVVSKLITHFLHILEEREAIGRVPQERRIECINKIFHYLGVPTPPPRSTNKRDPTFEDWDLFYSNNMDRLPPIFEGNLLLPMSTKDISFEDEFQQVTIGEMYFIVASILGLAQVCTYKQSRSLYQQILNDLDLSEPTEYELEHLV